MKSKSGVWRPPTSVKVFVILQALGNFPDVIILNTHFGQDQGSKGIRGGQGGQCVQNSQGGQNGSKKWF